MSIRARAGCGRYSYAGVTLVEILIALLVVVVVVGGALHGYRHFSILSEFSRQKSLALDHMESMLERIRTVALGQLAVEFPHGVADGPAGAYATLVGGYVLENEQITVTYPNPGATPLEIVVTITWNGPQGRPMLRTLSTLRAE